MKGKCILLFLNILISRDSVFAQSGWFPLVNAPKSIDLSDIYFINADTGFVNGTDQGAMRTTDGGETWKPMGFYAGKFKFYFNNTLGVCFSGFSVQMTTNYGRTWTQRPNIIADDIDLEKIALIRCYAVTHTVGFDQRYVSLASKQISSVELLVSIPANSNLLPPGYYYLFLVSKSGTPSIGHIIKVANAEQFTTGDTHSN